MGSLATCVVRVQGGSALGITSHASENLMKIMFRAITANKTKNQ